MIARVPCPFLIAATLVSTVTWAQNVQSPAAAAVLDRYVEVTGGVAAYKKINAAVMEMTLSGKGGSAHTTYFQARDGREQYDTEAGGKLTQRGVSNGGVVWEYSDVTGARLLSGKEAERRIASAKVFLDDDWRNNYPAASLIGSETVDGKPCAHVRLVRTDGAIRDVFYDTKTGLLIRQIMRDSETDENSMQITFVEYQTSNGIKYPALMRMSGAGGVELETKVDSAQFSAKAPPDAFVLPDKVVRAMASAKAGSGMPNAVDLLERYVAETGGKQAYAARKSEKITADISLAAAGLKGKLLVYEAGRKLYTSMELPGAGKFESGSDGKISWELSTLLGPRIVPNSEANRGMLGPGSDQIMSWLRAYDSIETVGKEEVNGAACWSVRMVSRESKQPPNTLCFDAESGYLVRLTGTSKSQMGTMAVDLVMSKYQDDGGIKSPHHVETKVSGQSLAIDVTQVEVNGPVPDGTFDLPNEIKALAAKKASGKEEAPPERPTLRRSR